MTQQMERGITKRIKVGTLTGTIVWLKFPAQGGSWIAGCEKEIPQGSRYMGEKNLVRVFPEELEDMV